jgi:hypothetical protein
MAQQPIFVFGSNLAGIHGAGAARYANKHLGAVWGVGEGHTGNCYALPTKDHDIKSLPLSTVREHVNAFIAQANFNTLETYQVTRVGCGLAGFNDADIAPLFSAAPSNCQFDSEWKRFLGDGYIYWGTF